MEDAFALQCVAHRFSEHLVGQFGKSCQCAGYMRTVSPITQNPPCVRHCTEDEKESRSWPAPEGAPTPAGHRTPPGSQCQGQTLAMLRGLPGQNDEPLWRLGSTSSQV